MQSLSDISLSSLNVIFQWIAAVSTAIAVFMAIGLIFVGMEMNRRQNKVISELNAKAETAKVEAARANERAAEADERAAVATERAAKANEQAEAERLARTRLAVSLLPRTFGMSGGSLDELELFATTKAVILYGEEDKEARDLAKTIGAALKNGKWTIVDVRSVPMVMEFGVGILVREDTDGSVNQKLYDAARILTFQLRDSGIAATFALPVHAESARFPEGVPADTITIGVGKRPLPYVAAENRKVWLETLKDHDPDLYQERIQADSMLREMGYDPDTGIRVRLTAKEKGLRRQIIRTYMARKDKMPDK